LSALPINSPVVIPELPIEGLNKKRRACYMRIKVIRKSEERKARVHGKAIQGGKRVQKQERERERERGGGAGKGTTEKAGHPHN
jgi:hypothetical protein